MAEKKTTKKSTKTKKTNVVTYKGQKYTLLEEGNGKVKLTDGTIHFWVKAKDVTAD